MVATENPLVLSLSLWQALQFAAKMGATFSSKVPSGVAAAALRETPRTNTENRRIIAFSSLPESGARRTQRGALHHTITIEMDENSVRA
jgi:hypothetical protein